jgi:hypothetical protein
MVPSGVGRARVDHVQVPPDSVASDANPLTLSLPTATHNVTLGQLTAAKTPPELASAVASALLVNVHVPCATDPVE